MHKHDCEKGFSAEKASKTCKREVYVSPHGQTLRKYLRNNPGRAGLSPKKKGRVPRIPHKVEKELVDMLMHFHNMGLVITIEWAVAFLEYIIEGTAAEQSFNPTSLRQSDRDDKNNKQGTNGARNEWNECAEV